MQHRVAIRANRLKIVYRVHDICRADLCQRHDVVHVDEAGSYRPKSSLEVKTTNQAFCAMMLDGISPRLGITLKAVHQDL